MFRTAGATKGLTVSVYLDHAATTPMSSEVLAAYVSALSVVGNPSSIHSQGQNAKRMLEESREQDAASLGADSVEVTFTSGGTEAINPALTGLWWARSALAPELVAPVPELVALVPELVEGPTRRRILIAA